MEERNMRSRELAPEWVEGMLGMGFFSVCGAHRDGPRSECNMYCLDCHVPAFCFYCRSSRHNDHLVIQIRRSSYHDVVRVGEIEKALDVSGVQTYVINSARVVFLNERPQPKASVKGGPHLCEICSRTLLDPFRFCSLGCKLVGIKKNGDANFVIPGGRNEGIGRRIIPSRVVEDLEEVLEDKNERSDQRIIGQGDHKNVYPINTLRPTHSNSSRRRKGIPHRAPLGP